MGHVRIPHDVTADPFAGICPFHGDCLEGLASGPAMNARWLQPAEQLPSDHPGWTLEARYLALALVNFICTLSPERIVIGGGVMSKEPVSAGRRRSSSCEPIVRAPLFFRSRTTIVAAVRAPCRGARRAGAGPGRGVRTARRY